MNNQKTHSWAEVDSRPWLGFDFSIHNPFCGNYREYVYVRSGGVSIQVSKIKESQNPKEVGEAAAKLEEHSTRSGVQSRE